MPRTGTTSPSAAAARDWAEYPEDDDAPRSARREESDRRAASPLTYDATPLQPSPAPPSPRPSPAPPSPTRPERPPCTLEDLRDRWGTCVYLLRSPDVRDAQALEKTRQAAEDGVAYVEEVKTVAQRLKIRGGALSKMLLPYGEETSTLRAGPHVESRRIRTPRGARAARTAREGTRRQSLGGAVARAGQGGRRQRPRADAACLWGVAGFLRRRRRTRGGRGRARSTCSRRSSLCGHIRPR